MMLRLLVRRVRLMKLFYSHMVADAFDVEIAFRFVLYICLQYQNSSLLICSKRGCGCGK